MRKFTLSILTIIIIIPGTLRTISQGNDEIIWYIAAGADVIPRKDGYALIITAVLDTDVNWTIDKYTTPPIEFKIINSEQQEVWCWCPIQEDLFEYELKQGDKYFIEKEIILTENPTLDITEPNILVTKVELLIVQIYSTIDDFKESILTLSFEITRIDPIEVEIVKKEDVLKYTTEGPIYPWYLSNLSSENEIVEIKITLSNFLGLEHLIVLCSIFLLRRLLLRTKKDNI